MSSSNSSGGIGLPMILFLIFLVLKLCGIITWSWWWVTCPLWIGLAIGGVIMLIGLVVGGGALGIAGLLSMFTKK
jgi:hypothetical protein